MHSGGARQVLQFVAHPLHRRQDGVVRIVPLGQVSGDPFKTLTGGRIGRRDEDFVEAVGDRLGGQIRPVDVRRRRFGLVSLHHGGRRHLQLGVRGVQIESRHRRPPVVDVAIRPCRRRGFDTVDDDVLAGVRPRSEPSLVVGRGDRRLVGITGLMDHTHAPHQIAPSSIASCWPASDQATHNVGRKYCNANASPTSRQVACSPARRISS